jgi:hypothetical protein
VRGSLFRLPIGIDDFENRCIFTYGMARVLLVGDAEGREEEYVASGPYTGPLTVHQRSETTHTLSHVSAPCWPEERLG